ncbi:serine acetyltransferase [Crocinitomicaceae bacterium]|nr:serine acetyltransferase [Crocinitomicaceae bacterium]
MIPTQDWKANKANPKGRIILLFFRFCSIGNRHLILFLLLMPFLITYRVLIEWVLGVELPYKTKIGPGLILFHGQALVINDGSILGSNCTIRHCTTIGNKRLQDGSYSKCPVIGNNVDLGSNVCIIGPITIGDNVTIGSGSIVTKDIPDNCVIVGNPARILKEKN